MMDRDEAQRRIDQVAWYHEFDFGNGLVARSRAPDVESHRRMWAFITGELDKIDFTGKTVLDLGCWDGYWSFYAERRGAKSVLATDDRSQNWAGSAGVLLAKELLGSSIEVRLDVSVYDVAKLNRTFDIVLCMGIYYHLVDPFYAFSQVRQVCHPGSIAVFEGEYSHRLEPPRIHYDLSDHAMPIFVPSRAAIAQMLEANYFEIARQTTYCHDPHAPIPLKKRVKRSLKRWWRGPKLTGGFDRIVNVCEPFAGESPLHVYRPPFGLHRYDPRFRDA